MLFRSFSMKLSVSFQNAKLIQKFKGLVQCPGSAGVRLLPEESESSDVSVVNMAGFGGRPMISPSHAASHCLRGRGAIRLFTPAGLGSGSVRMVPQGIFSLTEQFLSHKHNLFGEKGMFAGTFS